jgi:hypothetical protein
VFRAVLRSLFTLFGVDTMSAGRKSGWNKVAVSLLLLCRASYDLRHEEK